jgi:CheY-like chemotaxis protein
VECTSASPAFEQSAIALGGSPATGNPRFEHPSPAPLFELEQVANEVTPGTSAAERLVELLSGLLNQSVAPGPNQQSGRPAWNPRKALVCIPEDNRDSVARALAESGYQVFVAQDTGQAVDRMRENQLDVVLLDQRFDPVEQGTVFVTREVNILRPAQRRRLFFVLLSTSLRTMDSHAAFLNNANAIINLNEIAELPALIEHRVREFNELYKDFNHVTKMPAL